jgi:ATP-dependent Clp protease, protease subunit
MLDNTYMAEATPEVKEKEEGRKYLNRLLETRSIFICSEINQKVAKEVIEQLLLMSHESDDDITIFINSQGGHVESGDSIHDMIRFIAPKVKIVGTGWVASIGTHIFLSVPLERRYSLPNTRFLIHQPMGGVQGQARDIEIEAEEILKIRKRINEEIARETGQTIEKVSKDTDRNFWMSSEEAKKYGLVGQIINYTTELK